MPRNRLQHRLRMLNDRDALHSLGVAAAACVLSLGLVYVGYFVHVLRIARNAPCAPERGECVLLFGKHAPAGRPDADFEARLARAATVWATRPPQRMLLLGGGPAGTRTEAALARDALLARGLGADAPLLVEDQSRDTLQNLRNARALLAAAAGDAAAPVRAGVHVTLLSSRYHLARCALFARQLGFDWELCAAESRWSWHPLALWRVAGEAAYVCWVDVGTRWARLIGHRRMLARIS
ncbi:YdcF family protein [Luteimonas sp. BDR2-5]|uniref:ElyC/SanA/YdcF family protein n=1 Tax=Proluteimonas luteida TaxID=2878685 RepID=UPI001E383B20|nr:ElyC/SanA/YdcF family protein [Luteimonas sp. BDR2-5]MCD9027279.1 YdcF family protein [Luteimonas sp. BDR2-5]